MIGIFIWKQGKPEPLKAFGNMTSSRETVMCVQIIPYFTASFYQTTMQLRLKTLCFLCLPIALIAQPKIDLEEIRQKWPNASAVVLNEEVLNLDVVNDKLTATRDHVNYYVLLDEKYIALAERSVTFIPGFFELQNFEATTYVPNGRSYKKLKVTQWEDRGEVSQMYFYDDVKYRHFVFPGAQKGAVLELKYTYNHKDPTLQFPFQFQESVPMVKGAFTLRYSEKVKPFLRLFGDSVAMQKTMTSKNGFTSLTWQVENVPEWKGFANAPSFRYNMPHVFPLIQEYQTSKGWQKGLVTVKELYAHDVASLKDLNKTAPLPEIKQLVDSLKAVSSGNEALIRNIYYWVQENVKYIAFEDGLGGFVPRQANDIFRKRFGDCKDMSSLLTVMLKEAKIPAYICWIGTRDLPYRYQDLPLPNADNHMIAAVFQNNKWVFLDGTARFLPYGVPSGFIQGKEALVGISDDSFEVVKVPVLPTDANKRYDSTHLVLTDNKLKGSILLKLTGYPQYDLMERLKLTKSDKVNEVIEHSLHRGNNKCKIENLGLDNLQNRDQPFSITAKMELPDYARLIEDNWYVNLNLDKGIANLKIDTTGRKVAREFEYQVTDTRVVSLEIPAGYQVAKMPNKLEYKSETFGYSMVYTKDSGQVKAKLQFNVNVLLLSYQEFGNWNKHIDKIVQAMKEVVVLEKVK
jgi:hypothetical protein